MSIDTISQEIQTMEVQAEVDTTFLVSVAGLTRVENAIAYERNAISGGVKNSRELRILEKRLQAIRVERMERVEFASKPALGRLEYAVNIAEATNDQGAVVLTIIEEQGEQIVTMKDKIVFMTGAVKRGVVAIFDMSERQNEDIGKPILWVLYSGAFCFSLLLVMFMFSLVRP